MVLEITECFTVRKKAAKMMYIKHFVCNGESLKLKSVSLKLIFILFPLFKKALISSES